MRDAAQVSRVSIGRFRQGLAIGVVLLGLVAGCTSVRSSPTPKATEPHGSVPPSHASQPTIDATPSARADVLGSQWVPVSIGDETSVPRAAAFGPANAVIVGGNCVGPAEAPECTAAAWYTDAEGAWLPARVDDAASARIDEVVYRDGFLALGSRIAADGALVTALIWESADGATWKRTGSVAIGLCSGEGPVCGHAWGLVAGPNELMILRDVYAASSQPFFGSLRSTNGEDWAPIPLAAFGGANDEASITAAIAWADGVIALVTGDARPLTAWRTTDGLSWTQVGTFGDRAQSVGGLAAGGGTVVAAEGESSSAGFRTTMWTATEGTAFERRATFGEDRDVLFTTLVYTGPTGFLAAGHEEGRPQLIGSDDGSSWYAIEPGLPQIDCSPAWLAGGASTALYVGECGTVWMTTRP